MTSQSQQFLHRGQYSERLQRLAMTPDTIKNALNVPGGRTHSINHTPSMVYLMGTSDANDPVGDSFHYPGTSVNHHFRNDSRMCQDNI
ncbi:MAG: hypothetical protein GXP08_05820 [Gammaproteobacteria bacterium]|nr:hypothetical protein [Gammaproteobacteria bacterium]